MLLLPPPCRVSLPSVPLGCSNSGALQQSLTLQPDWDRCCLCSAVPALGIWSVMQTTPRRKMFYRKLGVVCAHVLDHHQQLLNHMPTSWLLQSNLPSIVTPASSMVTHCATVAPPLPPPFHPPSPPSRKACSIATIDRLLPDH